MWFLKKLLAPFRRRRPLTAERLPARRRPPHRANVPGPFYIEDGCCTACAVWETVAPDLLAWTEDGERKYPHCYVARQPETDAEFLRMMDAMQVAELDCIRVHACRPDWTARFIAAGHEGQIDPPEGPAKA